LQDKFFINSQIQFAKQMHCFVKEYGCNLSTLDHIALRDVFKPEKPFLGDCFRYVMFRVCQYTTDKTKFCTSVTTHIKTTQAVLQNDYMIKRNGKCKQVWNAVYVNAILCQEEWAL